MKKFLITFWLIAISFSGKAQYNKEVIIEPVLQTDTTTIGQKITYPQFAENEITILKITILPGKSTGWHKHYFPVFAYVLKGTLTVELENKEMLQFCENSSFAEVINTFHNGSNRTNDTLVLIAFYLGEKGTALSIYK